MNARMGYPELGIPPQGGGGGGMPPQGMPPQGGLLQGGMPPGGGMPPMPGSGMGQGAGIAQQLMMLLQQSPKAQQMLQMVVQRLMQQANSSPSGGMPVQAPGPQDMGEVPTELPPELAGELGPGIEDDGAPVGPKSTEDELAAAQEAMGADEDAGQWQGSDEPSEQDIAMLMDDPGLAGEFDARFGDGASANYIEGGGGKQRKPAVETGEEYDLEDE